MNYSRADGNSDNPVVSYSSAASPWRNEIKADRDETFNVSYREDADLGAFLARPIKIVEYTWNAGSYFASRFNPWELFLQNANVLKRIENYHLIRGDLEVEFMLNGNPFYYGRALVDYNPLHDFRIFNQGSNNPELFSIQASQRPHLFLDPSTSTGGQMFIPFFWPKNWINLTQADYKLMGDLEISALTNLRHANDLTPAPINISVFVRMVNVQLTMPTVNPVDSISPALVELAAAIYELDPENPMRRMSYTEKFRWLEKHGDAYYRRLKDDRDADIVPQSGKGNGKPKSSKGSNNKGNTHTGSTQSADEYGKGIISMPASILAKAAGSISNAPIIGKYALASKFALEGVGNIARIFGYSRPPIVSNIQPNKLLPAGYMASTNMDEVIAKLALDSKQELSIDPTTVGLDGVDQMSLSHVLQKESYITSFPWAEDNSPETALFSMNLAPAYFKSAGTWGTTSGFASVTPMSHFAQMFDNWRGSIVVRFQIVASQYHKGRLRVTYDPYSTGLFDFNSYNVAYNRIIDLENDRDFEMTFRWSQPVSWRRVPRIATIQDSQVYSNDAALLPLAEQTNGMFQVSVLNKLTTPNGDIPSPIEINVFVRAGDDFELANPSHDKVAALTFLNPDNGAALDAAIKPEAGEEPVNDTGADTCPMEADSKEMENAPVGVTQVNAVGGDPIPIEDNTLYVYMGEKVASLRQLLKRYTWHEAFQFNQNGGGTYGIRQNILNFPVYRGYTTSSRTNTGPPTPRPYNFCKTTWLNYVAPCYAGWRGGIRRKYQFTSASRGNVYEISRRTNPIVAGQQGQGSTDLSGLTPNELAADFSRQFDNAQAGAYTTDAVVQPTLEVEFPFYSEYRFAHTHTLQDTTVLTRRPECYSHNVEMIAASGGNPDAIARSMVAVGEDFSCFWFLNVPTVYAYDDPAI